MTMIWIVLGFAGVILLLFLFKVVVFAYIKHKIKLDYTATFSEVQDTSGFDVHHEFYQKITGNCREMGFRILGNIVESNHSHAFLKVFSSKDAAFIVACYSIRNPGNMVDLDGEFSNCIDVSSETKSGEFIETTSAFEAGFIETSPKIKRECFPRGTELSTLVERHLERIKGNEALVRLGSIQAVIASATRSYRVSEQFRNEQGGRIKTSEIENLQKNLDEKVLRKATDDSEG